MQAVQCNPSLEAVFELPKSRIAANDTQHGESMTIVFVNTHKKDLFIKEVFKG